MKLGSLNLSKIMFKHQSFDHISDQIQEVAQPDRGIIALFIVAVILLHIMTIAYRNSPSVKVTSPKLTHLAFVGSYVFIATIMLWSISKMTDFGPEIDAPICQVILAWRYCRLASL